MQFLANNLDLKKINLYLVLSLFLISITFVIIKGFVINKEVSDYLFAFCAVIIFELSVLLILNLNNFITFEKKIDYFLLSGIFLLIIFLWSNNSINLTINFISFIFFQTLVLSSLIFIEKYLCVTEKINTAVIFGYFILIGIFTALFNDTEYLTYNNLLILFFTNIVLIVFYAASFKFNKKISLIISFLIFIFFLKVFLLSSEKDPFHYSVLLGPVFSSLTENTLLQEIVSQYGYLNILLIKNITLITGWEIELSAIITIILFFLLFSFLLLDTIKKRLNYPMPILVLFICLILYANVGISNLSSAIFIPSSSVFRFFPSIVSILYLSNIYFYSTRNNLNKNIILFSFFFATSIFWSFESFFFVIFSTLSFLFFFIIKFILVKDVKNKLSIFFQFYKSQIYLFFLLFAVIFLILFFHIKFKDIIFFYEYAIGFEAALSEEIISSSTSLLFFFLLCFAYLILRSSFSIKFNNIFLYNILWFALFVSFSSYFLVRSHPNNIFSLLPFLIFFISIMKVTNKSLIIYRNMFIKSIIFLTILASALSIINNKEKIKKNFLSDEFFKIPELSSKLYQPSNKLEKKLLKYKDIPITLVSGKIIHKYNPNLNDGGYGLPILPLETFNLLSEKRKNNLMSKFFSQNRNHLILCLNNCNFYNSSEDRISWNDIFLPEFINSQKIFYNNTLLEETLYLLTKKN